MSTTFEVYPLKKDIPTYGEIIALASKRIAEFLADYSIPFDSKLVFDVRNERHESEGIGLASPFSWQGQGYSWFYFEGLAGGTDAYFKSVDELDRQCWEEEAAANPRMRPNIDVIRASLSQGHYWIFRRSAAQPPVINVAYGFLAAAVAELTDGLLHSSDSAWDYERMPCSATEFCRYWFRPEHGLSSDTRTWHQECLDLLRANHQEHT